MITSFVPVFDDKLKKHKKKLKELLAKPRAERDKKLIKALVKEAKELRDIIKDAKKHMKDNIKCPNCGHEWHGD